MPTAIILCLALVAGACTWTVYNTFDHRIFDLRSAVVAPLLSTLDARGERHATAVPDEVTPPGAPMVNEGS
jgi:hypothetical protein